MHMNNEEEYAELEDSAMMTSPAPTPAVEDYSRETMGNTMSPPMGSMPPSIMTEKGEFAPDWYSQFDELKDHASTLAKFRRPESLAKSYAALERMKGYPGVENAKQMESFRRSVGLPESAEDYSLTRPEGASEALWNDGFAGELAQLAYEYGVPASAMDALAERYCKEGGRLMQEQQLRQQEELAMAEADLQNTWGMRFDDNMSAIGGVLERLGNQAGVDVKALAENPALRASTDFAKLMLEVVNLVQEAPMRTGTPTNGKDEAYRIAHDPTHPLHEAYMRTNHPQHRHANEQYDRFAFGRRV